jgi:hypothetical protein
LEQSVTVVAVMVTLAATAVEVAWVVDLAVALLESPEPEVLQWYVSLGKILHMDFTLTRIL